MISTSFENRNRLVEWRIDFDVLFAAAVLVLSSGAFLWLLRSEASLTSGEREGALTTDVLWLSAYAIAVHRVFWSNTASQPRVRLKIPTPLILLYIFVCLSVLWSDAPLLTLMKLVALIGGAVLAYYLGARFTSGALLRVLESMYTWSVILCFVAVLLVPAQAIGTGDFAGVWQGIYSHKNSLGLNIALALLVFASVKKKMGKNSFIRYGTPVLALILLLMSQSTTSLVVCALCFGLFLVRNMARKHIRLFACLVLVVVLVAGFVDRESMTSKFLDVVERDVTLTGRTAVWGAVLLMASDRPWLGYGYGGFWRGADGPSSEVWKLANFEAFYSHNGFLDIFIDLGLVGLGLILIVLVHSLVLAVRCWLFVPSNESFWPILLWVFVVISNLTEGSLLGANLLPWILLLTTYLQNFQRWTALKKAEQSG